jgi:hypothetical protein
MEIAGRISKLGWHVVIDFEAVDLPELWDFFTHCRRQSPSITWAGPICPSRSTDPNSRCDASRGSKIRCGFTGRNNPEGGARRAHAQRYFTILKPLTSCL